MELTVEHSDTHAPTTMTNQDTMMRVAGFLPAYIAAPRATYAQVLPNILYLSN